MFVRSYGFSPGFRPFLLSEAMKEEQTDERGESESHLTVT